MACRDNIYRLANLIELDDTFVGVKRAGTRLSTIGNEMTRKDKFVQGGMPSVISENAAGVDSCASQELFRQNEELMRVQMQLDTARTRYSDLFNFAPIGYCTLSAEKVILEANHAVAALLGIEQNALVNQSINQFIFKEDRHVLCLYFEQLLEINASQSLRAFILQKAQCFKGVQGAQYYSNTLSTGVPSSSPVKATTEGPLFSGMASFVSYTRLKPGNVGPPAKVPLVINPSGFLLSSKVAGSSLAALRPGNAPFFHTE